MEGDFGGPDNAERVSDSLTISEAATLLGVHKNTVRNRIKDGTYKAEKVVTERGPTYLIDRDSIVNNLATNTLTSGSQEIVSPQAMEFVQELLRPFVKELGEVRERLGAERARRELLEDERTALEADRSMAEEELAKERRRREESELEREELRARLAELEAIQYPGPSESQEEPSPGPETPEPRSDAGGAHGATEEPQTRSWWQRWFGA